LSVAAHDTHPLSKLISTSTSLPSITTHCFQTSQTYVHLTTFWLSPLWLLSSRISTDEMVTLPASPRRPGPIPTLRVFDYLAHRHESSNSLSMLVPMVLMVLLVLMKWRSHHI
jgi:hypothetical protein